ncbi:hypothetical protein AAKU58_000670 [Oxalobacteraceae bacterium GrIS 1.18]
MALTLPISGFDFVFIIFSVNNPPIQPPDLGSKSMGTGFHGIKQPSRIEITNL